MAKKRRKTTPKRKPKDRFKVTCDKTNNTSEGIAQGNINVTIDFPGPRQVTGKSKIRFLCPFCGGVKSVDVGYSDDGEPFVMHELEPCQKFIDLEIDEYVQEVRLHYQKNKPVMN